MDEASCRIVYLGLPLGALALLRDGLNVSMACISRPAMPGMRRLRRQMAASGGLVLAVPDLASPSIREVIASAQPDLIVSWFWTRKVPPEVLTLAPHAFGVHPSLLPRHRGPDPYFWALASGDEETGVSAHFLAAEYDTGSVIAQRRLQIRPEWNSWQLARALDRPSLALMRSTAARFARGEDVPGEVQDEALASPAAEPDDDACELRWDWSAQRVLARIRAAAPYPGAFTGYGDETVVVLAARKALKTPKALEPGEVARTPEGVVIRAADDGVLLLEARREGEDTVLTGGAIAGLFPGVPVI